MERYLTYYRDCYDHPSQQRYAEAFIQGLLSNLDRKSIEPIALRLLEDQDVRGMQHFFKRSTLPETMLLDRYQKILSEQIGQQGGMLSVDETDFVKKGSHSVGVARQYCGRLGKTENCQAGVFICYASEKGYGLVDRQLYIPKAWFSQEYAEKRERCDIPKEVSFQTKNKIASELLKKRS